ncbi:unnamed protein product [Ranitomeya imitator]|uniref:ubiquitinyl hydrolase 1 n=1 Tax=Ranitomeya imitator TaxID=111125 RepID=A0ABN9LD78_9NEOB|nr:unnamed protein product [Ranitomeya imitator]
MGECPVYHERQRLELCAIHALNNLLQRAEVTQHRAEEICWGSLDTLALSEIFGFILNIPSPISLGFFSLPITRKHWIAVRQIGGIYYNLDSKLKSPVRLGGPRELRDFLQGCISRGSCEILLVVTKDVEESRLWMKESEETS